MRSHSLLRLMVLMSILDKEKAEEEIDLTRDLTSQTASTTESSNWRMTVNTEREVQPQMVVIGKSSRREEGTESMMKTTEVAVDRDRVAEEDGMTVNIINTMMTMREEVTSRIEEAEIRNINRNVEEQMTAIITIIEELLQVMMTEEEAENININIRNRMVHLQERQVVIQGSRNSHQRQVS